ncbi:MAG TPA: glycosyltransferase family 2 protein [Thermoanaerobaculia bacterium]|nr:glycosyltransferase family 2 protein [Thermoanaerobaculia bacterium]
MSEIDAIVLDLDGGSALEELLSSMEAQTLPFARIIVWDNGSVVPVRERVAPRRLPLVHGRSEQNLGFTGGIDAAMRLTEAPLVAWINNDVVLAPAWNERLSARFADARLAAAQSVVLGTDGRIDGAGISIDGGVFRQRGHGLETARLPPGEPWGISATAAMFRAEALRDAAIGGRLLHPAFFLYYEDVELSARLRERGWRLALVGEPLATHRGSMSAARYPQAELLRVRNRYFVNRLHPGVGSLVELLSEDAGRLGRRLLRLDLRAAATVLGGVVAGLSAPLRIRSAPP